MNVQDRLILFDLDGTLAELYGTRLLPGVAEWFQSKPRHIETAIVTNQGGVGLRYWMETAGFGEPDKYPTPADIKERVGAVISQLGSLSADLSLVGWYVCYAYQGKKGNWGPKPPTHHPFYDRAGCWREDWRKPAPGMILAALFDNDCQKKDALMVGDSEEDQQAAEAAGVAFRWAKEFFCRDS